MFGLPSQNYMDVVKMLKDYGFTDIVVGYNIDHINAVKKGGLKVHVVLPAFRIYDKYKDSKYLAEDVYGRKHIWFSSGCPNNPELRINLLNKVKEIVKALDVDGIILDGIRFASPGSGLEAFATCFCEECRRKADFTFRISFDLMKNSVENLLSCFYDFKKCREILELYDYSLDSYLYVSKNFKHILYWLEFRSRSIIEVVKDVRNLIKSIDSSVELGAYVFMPTLALLVGQDYTELWRYLDTIKPMTYRIGRGVSCLNYELYITARDILKWNRWLKEEEILKILYKIFGLDGLENLPKTLDELMSSGMPIDIIYRETSIARKLIGNKCELHPIIMFHDEYIVKAVQNVIKAGADGVDFFRYREEYKYHIDKIVKVVKSLT